MAGHKCLEKMLSGQKEINHGGGGLADAPTPEVLTEYRRSGLKLPTARNPFSLALHEPNAESLLHAMFALHCEELAAQQLLHKSQTAQAMGLTALLHWASSSSVDCRQGLGGRDGHDHRHW